MKNKLMLTALLAAFSTAVLADNVIVTHTKTWKSVPITVDAEKHTYTTTETAMPEGDYYYTYSGYRCLREKMDAEGVNVVTYHGVSGGSDIYCYPE